LWPTVRVRSSRLTSSTLGVASGMAAIYKPTHN
jgi:hypothetical protein